MKTPFGRLGPVVQIVEQTQEIKPMHEVMDFGTHPLPWLRRKEKL